MAARLEFVVAGEADHHRFNTQGKNIWAGGGVARRIECQGMADPMGSRPQQGNGDPAKATKIGGAQCIAPVVATHAREALGEAERAESAWTTGARD